MVNMSTFRLFDYYIDNIKDDDLSDEEMREKKDKKECIIQIFGMNENGEKASIIIKGFCPYFLVKVGSHWTKRHLGGFLDHLKNRKLLC